MKKAPEINIVKRLYAATIIPAFVLACVVAKLVLSQATSPETSVAGVIAPVDRLNNLKIEQPVRAEMPDRLYVEKDALSRQKQSTAESGASGTAKDQPELNLLLISTSPGSSTDAMALIKDLESNSVGIYKTSQNIGRGYIESIAKDRVVVVVEGRSFTLKPAFSEAPRETVALAETTKSRVIPIGSTPSLENYENPRTKVDSLKSVLSKAKLETFLKDGQVQGLRVAGLDNALLANEMDLREGDVIHRINGHLLINKQQAWQVLKKARSQGTIDVEVLYDD